MDVLDLIPQREPFLFINEIQSIDENTIETSMHFHSEMDFFKGHFPNRPVVPGVLMNEHCFQSAAALIAYNNKEDKSDKLAVVSRIQSAKFKNIVGPNETIKTKTTLIEMIGNAAFFKSIVTNESGKKVLIIEFSAAMIDD